MKLSPKLPKIQLQKTRNFIKANYIWLVVGVLAIIIGASLDYRAYSDHKFNAVVTTLQSQQERSTENYATVVSLDGQIQAISSSSSDQLALANSDESKVKQIVSASCADQATDITGENLDSKVSHLWLNGGQRSYITDEKAVFSDLGQSLLTSKGMCTVGPSLLAYDENYINLLPGTVVFEQLQDNPAAPTAQQLSVLQSYTRKSVINEAALQKFGSGDVLVVSSMIIVYANTYNELEAASAGNSTLLAQYETKVNQAATAYGTANTQSIASATKFDKTVYDADIKAAKADVSLLGAQKNNSQVFSRLDYSIPVYWLLDAKIGLYAKVGVVANSSPHAGDVHQLVSILNDNYLTSLYNRGLLKNVTYTSLGTNNSGVKLTVPTSNGQTITDYSPAQQ